MQLLENRCCIVIGSDVTLQFSQYTAGSRHIQEVISVNILLSRDHPLAGDFALARLHLRGSYDLIVSHSWNIFAAWMIPWSERVLEAIIYVSRGIANCLTAGYGQHSGSGSTLLISLGE